MLVLLMVKGVFKAVLALLLLIDLLDAFNPCAIQAAIPASTRGSAGPNRPVHGAVMAVEALRLNMRYEALYRSLGPEHPYTLKALSKYAAEYSTIGQEVMAAPLKQRVLNLRRKVLGKEHLDTVSALVSYAMTLDRLGREDEAEPLLKEALEVRQEELGRDHPQTLSVLKVYALTLQKLGREAEANPLLKEVLRLTREALGTPLFIYNGNRTATLRAMRMYANTLTELGCETEAFLLYREGLEMCRSMRSLSGVNKVLAKSHLSEIESLSEAAIEGMTLADVTDALLNVLDVVEQVFTELEHEIETAKFSNSYAVTLLKLGREADAEPFLKEARRLAVHRGGRLLAKELLEVRRRILGSQHPAVAEAVVFYEAATRNKTGFLKASNKNERS